MKPAMDKQSPDDVLLTQADLLDIFTALTHIWLGLDAIKKQMPDDQSPTLNMAVAGLATSMSSLMDRHNIRVERENSQDPASP